MTPWLVCRLTVGGTSSGVEDLDPWQLTVLLDRLEERMVEVEALEEEARRSVFDLLDGINALHRFALPAGVHTDDLERLRSSDAVVEWSLSAYAVGADERTVGEQALELVRSLVRSHGASVELRQVGNGVVLRLGGACSGCTATSVTLGQGIEEGLPEHLPGFVSVEVEDDDRVVVPRTPPVETVVQLRAKA